MKLATDPAKGGRNPVVASIRGHVTADLVRDYGIVAAFCLLFAILAITTPNFLTIENLRNVAEGNAYLGIAACGATLVIISGGFDLSIGAIYGLAGVIAASVATHWDPVLGLALGGLAGLLVGLVNGTLVTVLRLHSFLATLAAGLIVGGVAVTVSGGFLVDASAHSSFTWLGRERLIAGIPNPVLLFALVAVLLGWVLARTRYGRYVYAVGGNSEAARLSGIRVSLVVATTFAISGLTAALAGLVAVSNSGTGQAIPAGAEYLPLDAIAAAVIGGTSIKGGQGAIWRTVLGVMFVALIHNAFNIMSVESQYQNMFTGAIIIVAVAANSLAGRR